MKKETLQYRIDNCLCTRCGAPVVSGRKMCKKHLEQSCEKEKVKRAKRKAKMVCIRCGKNPPREGKTQCVLCAENNREEYNAAKMDIYYQRRSASRCVRCDVKTDNFSVHCEMCTTYMRDKDSRYYYVTKEADLCVHCRDIKPIDGEILCQICKDKNAARGAQNRKKQKMAVVEHYGGECSRCGETDLDVLCIDHIDGGGGQHRKRLAKDGTTTYRWLVKNNYPVGFQVLCFNCNIKKHLNGGICPHLRPSNLSGILRNNDPT